MLHYGPTVPSISWYCQVRPDGGGASLVDCEDRAEVLFALLEDCIALLPAWMRQQPAGAAAADDVAQVTEVIPTLSGPCVQQEE